MRGDPFNSEFDPIADGEGAKTTNGIQNAHVIRYVRPKNVTSECVFFDIRHIVCIYLQESGAVA